MTFRTIGPSEEQAIEKYRFDGYTTEYGVKQYFMVESYNYYALECHQNMPLRYPKRLHFPLTELNLIFIITEKLQRFCMHGFLHHK